jgi:acyl carrier protein
MLRCLPLFQFSGEIVSSTLTRLSELFQDVFDDDELEISRETTAANVEGWDSLMHVHLVVAAERAFNVRFSSSEVATLLDVGELVDLIDAKVGDAAN